MAAALLAAVLFSRDSFARPTAQAPGEQGVVKGTVSYRERMALPPDAAVEVWITDVSPLILAQALLAEATIVTEGRQVPILFELRYDPSRIVADHDYAVKAAIRSAGEILFATETGALVITKGNPTDVQLWLTRATGGAEGDRTVLQGTAWRLEDLGGESALDTVEATLEFPEAGRVAGSGSCNRFFGSVEISGESIRFGQLGSTQMSCEEAVNNQESKYLRALGAAERFTLEATTLLIYSRGMEKPLRFAPKEP
jgi:putative lipoprotein